VLLEAPLDAISASSAVGADVLKLPLAPLVLATVHPSSILRAPDEEARHREMKRFTDDLRAVARALSRDR